MSTQHTGFRAGVLILTVLVTMAMGCSRSGDKALLEGLSSVDLVNPGESIKPDGQNDAVISLRLNPGGLITSITVHDVDGQPALWDTIPGNSLWALGVADKEKPNELLNKPDSTVEIKTDKARDILLYFADNGAVRGGKTRFAVTVTYADGTKKEIAVERRK